MRKAHSIFLITDLDGTLLRTDKTISNANLQAIQRLRDAGGQFSIATGRTIQATQRYLEQLHVTMPIILYNGAAIYDPVKETVLYSITLPKSAIEITRAVLEQFPEIGAEVLRADGIYVVRNTPREAEHTALCQVNPIYCTMDTVPANQWLKVLFAMDPILMRPLQEFLAQQNGRAVSFVQSSDVFYEMLPKGVTKGSALAVYRKLCSLETATIVAAGDYDNDIEMLEYAEIGAAPANAQDSVKQTADWILPQTCDENAIAACIDAIFNLK